MCFDYSQAESRELTQKLVEEIDSQADGGRRALTIGACIRSFTMASDPARLAHYNEERDDALMEDEDEDCSDLCR